MNVFYYCRFGFCSDCSFTALSFNTKPKECWVSYKKNKNKYCTFFFNPNKTKFQKTRRRNSKVFPTVGVTFVRSRFQIMLQLLFKNDAIWGIQIIFEPEIQQNILISCCKKFFWFKCMLWAKFRFFFGAFGNVPPCVQILSNYYEDEVLTFS